mmetsp:Transcript_23265/g.60442  ORF Transcript_23265/g.60442 Transcript_23265/m.60442 type:complete len:371 (-) Transcript_23265:80-1192(-)
MGEVRQKKRAKANIAEADLEEAGERKPKKQKKVAPQLEEDIGAENVKQKKQGKKQNKAAASPSGAGVQDATPTEKPSQTRTNKKKRKKKQATESASAVGEESELDTQRKEAQREIQQLVVRLRAEGKTDAEIRVAKSELKVKHGNLRKPDGHRETKTKAWKEWISSDKGQEEKVQTRAEKLQIKHQLVVIPVVWRGRHDHLGVQRAAEDVKACVAQQGVDVWVDSRRQYTPGQKFAHWEYRGVMLRVEVGPEDLEKGVCRVCRVKTPGDYKSVERKLVKLPPVGARKLLLTLKEWGLDSIEIERREGDDEEGDEDDEGEMVSYGNSKVGAEGAGASTADDQDDAGGNWAPRVAEKAERRDKKKKYGGKAK